MASNALLQVVSLLNEIIIPQWVDSIEGGRSVNFGANYHELGLEWNKDEFIFYQDGVEIRRTKNDFCHSPAPIWLSLATIPWGGTVTEAIDGTSMKVDWVRYYAPKK